ncbi:MAG TPA: peptide chain release factor N(5)-glutamine methyltransferase [Gemmataceae bacterium]|nr:peptide chain release factor N(5)-glutamine methyltransferase [Gemmataceae bacterium]
MSTEQPWTIGRLLDWTTKFLQQKGSESPRLDSEVLLAHALDCKRIDLYARHSEEAPEQARQRFRELVRQRVEGCPVAYLVGRKEFFSLEFTVTRAVLIPRPDTECVVDECLRLAKALAAPAILDIGTGSGCLAVAIAKHHKTARVTAVDRSSEALAVASENAQKHGVAERIRFLQGDLFAPLADERFDFILSNPPYIPHDDIGKLAPGVRDYEPHSALDGGVDGFTVFDCLIAETPAHLKTNGYLLIEIGSPQEGPARERIERHGGYELAKTVHDGSGHPRVLIARLRA